MPYIKKGGITYGGFPNATVASKEATAIVPSSIKQLTRVGGTQEFAPVTIPEAVKFSEGGSLETTVNSIATIESSSTASKAYVVGDFLVSGGQLYKVIADIAIGETFVVDTNIESTSVGSELSELNAGLVVQFLSTGWTTTETVNNITYYTQTVSVTSVSGKPIIGITPISGTLPTSAEQNAFDSVEYFTANDTTNTIKGYATSAPTETFAVVVKGAR